MATPEGAEKITEEQATAALHQLTHEDSGEPETPVEVAEQPAVEAEPAPVEAKEEDAKEETVETATEVVEAAATDDVASLKTRLEEAEKKAVEREEDHKERLASFKERSSESSRIMRDRYVRKSAAADNARRVIEAAKTDAGVDPVEADRVLAELKSTLHPDSANYAPPVQRTAATEDQQVVINEFLDEKEMTTKEGDKFGLWVKTEASAIMSPLEQQVAHESLPAFLRLAHGYWKKGVREEQNKQVDDAVGAVKAVKQTQKAAAKAASASPAAPKKQPVNKPTGTSPKDYKPEDISALLRASVEEYQ